MDNEQIVSQNSSQIIKPFLRWAGGKSWLLKMISRFLPQKFNNYHEPFLGGGAVFFHLRQLGKLNGEAILSDINEELIQCFVQIRDNLEEVIKYLKKYKNELDFYYYMRELVPSTEEECAAKFIYLNRTSFNGVYRVNLNGAYNVPYGFKRYKTLFDFGNLRRASTLLQGTKIISRDFECCLSSVGEGDLVFLDPPYTVAHDNNAFVKYNQRIFAWRDQQRLANTTMAINEKSAYFILTNAAHPSIKSLFEAYGETAELRRFSVIGGKEAARTIRSEYIFWNSNYL